MTTMAAVAAVCRWPHPKRAEGVVVVPDGCAWRQLSLYLFGNRGDAGRAGCVPRTHMCTMNQTF